MRLPSRRFDVEQRPDRVHVGQHLRRDGGELVVDRLGVDLLEAVAAAQRIVMRQQAVDLLVERAEIGEIHQADRAAADLVLIGRTDAALGGADARAGVGGLAQRVELLMQRQDQRDVLGDAQIVRRDRDALRRRAGRSPRAARADRAPRRCRSPTACRAAPRRRAAARACRSSPSMTSVWPALWPPWKRTTTSACSDSQSTILPLPSSPHWDPTTTTFAMRTP